MEWTARLPDEVWRAVLTPQAGANFFHTPEWAEVVARCFPGSRVEYLCGVRDGRYLVLTAVSIRRPWPLTPSLLSMPWHTTGGPLKEGGGLTQADAAAVATALLARRSTTVAVVSRADEREPAWRLPGFRRRAFATRALSLDAGYEHVFTRVFTRRLRKAVHKAESLQVRAELDDTGDRIADYVALTRAHGRTSAGEGRHLERLLPELLLRPGARLYVAQREGRLLSGMVVLAGAAEWYCWQGATSPEGRLCQANAQLFAAVARDAANHAAPRLNLGPSRGLPRVDFFKASTGAAELRYWVDSAGAWFARLLGR